MAKPSWCLALFLACAALMQPAAGQGSVGVTGGAYVPASGAFAQAFEHGPSLGLFASVHLVRGLSLRVALQQDLLPYDRARFFRQLGMESVDLDGQLGGDARLRTWSIGPELTLWRTASVRLYSFGMVGRVSRSTSTAPLVALYCEAPGVPPGSTPPSGCTDAERETQIAGSGAAFALGAGARWRWRGRTFVSLEAGYDRALLSPASSGFPVRLGYSITF
ncbi:MAG TPA: hypothetical protein VK467_10100 [Gemmatimonadales bacterium]|nr:hypothetical protein [Gemmatimonadales bacterium]